MYGQGPPITVETPIMLGLGGSGIRTFNRFTSVENGHAFVHVLTIPYNFSTKSQIGIVMPFVFNKPENTISSSGLGDLTLFAKYQLYKIDDIGKTFRITAKITQSIPTKSSSLQDPNNTKISQTYIGIIVGKLSTKTGIYGDFGYNLTNSGLTDNIIYNISFGFPLLEHQYPQKQVNLYLEVNGNYLIDPKRNVNFLSPGIQWIPGRRFLLEYSFQLPIFQDNSQINSTNFRSLIGIRFLIN